MLARTCVDRWSAVFRMSGALRTVESCIVIGAGSARTRPAADAATRKPRVSPRTDTEPARIPRAHLEIDMEDVPLTLADLIGAVLIGLALGALIGFAL